jgi:hypothetical protein
MLQTTEWTSLCVFVCGCVKVCVYHRCINYCVINETACVYVSSVTSDGAECFIICIIYENCNWGIQLPFLFTWRSEQVLQCSHTTKLCIWYFFFLQNFYCLKKTVFIDKRKIITIYKLTFAMHVFELKDLIFFKYIMQLEGWYCGTQHFHIEW